MMVRLLFYRIYSDINACIVSNWSQKFIWFYSQNTIMYICTFVMLVVDLNMDSDLSVFYKMLQLL